VADKVRMKQRKAEIYNDGRDLLRDAIVSRYKYYILRWDVV
jgi:hypothetical protein